MPTARVEPSPQADRDALAGSSAITPEQDTTDRELQIVAGRIAALDAYLTLPSAIAVRRLGRDDADGEPASPHILIGARNLAVMLLDVALTEGDRVPARDLALTRALMNAAALQFRPLIAVASEEAKRKNGKKGRFILRGDLVPNIEPWQSMLVYAFERQQLDFAHRFKAVKKILQFVVSRCGSVPERFVEALTAATDADTLLRVKSDADRHRIEAAMEVLRLLIKPPKKKRRPDEPRPDSKPLSLNLTFTRGGGQTGTVRAYQAAARFARAFGEEMKDDASTTRRNRSTGSRHLATKSG